MSEGEGVRPGNEEEEVIRSIRSDLSNFAGGMHAMPNWLAGLPEPISLRDWFAGMAMIGLIVRSVFYVKYTSVLRDDAYRLADAMMKERGK